MRIKLETINCDLCNSNDYKFIASQTDIIHKSTKQFFNVVRCNKCGLKFTNPRPTFDSIGNFYTSEYNYYQKNSILKIIFRKLISRIVRIKIFNFFSIFFPNKLNQYLISYIIPKIKDPVINYIENYSSSKKINFIDIGCGSGSNVHFWGPSSSIKNLSSKINVYGIEPSPKSREIIKANKIKVFSSINEVKRNIKFEIIRLNWSLEHVHKPKIYFQFIQEHLTKNGIAIICVPNDNGLIYKIDKNCLELPIHLYHFDKNSLIKYANLFKLKLSLFRTFSYPGMYSYAKKIGLLNSENDYDKVSLLEASHIMKIHKEIDNAELGNDILAVFKLE